MTTNDPLFNIYIDAIEHQNHVALIGQQSRKLEDLFLDYPRGFSFHEPKWAAIYYARVSHIDIKMNAAFVDLGNDKQGILPVKHIYTPADENKTKGRGQGRAKRDITQILGPGDWIFVQIKAEGHDAEDSAYKKLPRLTTKIHIPGRTLLYSPNVVGIFSSHWVNERDENEIGSKLTKQHDRGGWVIRQMAPDIPEQDLLHEAEHLVIDWETAKEKAREARDKQEPAKIYDAPEAIERALIDYGRRGIGFIETMTNEQAAMATAWATKYAPDLVDKISVAHFSPNERIKSLFEAHDIYSALDIINEKVVYLPSGGSITLERTEACAVIDVNSGPADKFQTNMEAAVEVMRQIRVRNYSGIILCDMINMSNKSQRHQVLETCEMESRYDPANTQVHGFTRLMMLEMTRRRRTASLRDKTSVLKESFPS